MKSYFRGEKYDAITKYLSKVDKDNLKLTFAEIEKILGFDLPRSARQYAAFWSHPKSHTLPYCFSVAGFQKDKVNIHDEYIILKKINNYNEK